MKSQLKNLSLILVLLVLPLGVYLATRTESADPLARASGQSGPVNLYFEPPQATTSQGELLQFSVKIETEREVITGGEIIINYNPDYLTLSGEVEKGTFFDQLVSNVADGQIVLTGDGEVIGQGTVANISFQALAPGELSLEIAPSSAIWGKVGQGNLLGVTNSAKVTIN